MKHGSALACILYFILTACLTQAQENAKSYDWGRVAKKTSNGEEQLHVNIDLNTFKINIDAKTSIDLSSAETIGDNYLQKKCTFYLALPANTELSLQIKSIDKRTIHKSGLYTIKRYRLTSDSSSLEPVLEFTQPLMRGTSSNPVKVEGYEWYRGNRLARLSINPFSIEGAEIYFTHSLDIAYSYTQSKNILSVKSYNDESHFNDAISKIVINSEDLKNISRAKLNWNDSTGNWLPNNGIALKLALVRDGIFRLRFEDLQTFIPSINTIDPGRFKLFNKGKQIPLRVVSVSQSQFAAGDYIEFPGFMNYGDKNYKVIPQKVEDEYPQYLNRYTDTSFYWFAWDDAAGNRVDTISYFGTTQDTLTWYTEIVHLEKDNILQYCDANDETFRQDPRWTSGDMWSWGQLNPNNTFSRFNFQFKANDIASSYPNGKIYVRAASATWPGTIPKYRLRLVFNSSDTINSVNDAGLSQHILMSAEVPASSFLNGTNTIGFISLSASSIVNTVFYDWADAEYPRSLVAVNDTLHFSFPSLSNSAFRTIKITNFSTNDIVVYKCNPGIKRITNISISGSSPYTVFFNDTVNPGDKYIACAVSKINTPIIKGIKQFKTLRNVTNGADYLLITNKLFADVANSYASLIGSRYNYRTKLVDVEDIFDEYGFGYPTPESIREFLRSTTQWQSPMPSYVCLVGDASYDYKQRILPSDLNMLGINAVPSYGNPVSDAWMTVLDDSSNLPQMYIGRIPARDLVEFERYIQHVEAYFNGRNDDWNKRFIFFAGGATDGEIGQFKQVNNEIITTMVNLIPTGGVAANFYKTTNPQSNFGPYSQEYIKEIIDNGAVFINYVGHSGTQTWDNSIGDPIQLQNNRGRYSLISDFGCSTGKFAEPNIRAFGEMFTVGENSSAIAYIGNSSLGFFSNATTLPQLFYKQFLQKRTYPIGKAHLDAKLERLKQDGQNTTKIMMLTNALIGDPAIELDLPKQPNLTISSLDIKSIPVIPTDDIKTLELNIPYKNTGIALADTFAFKISHQYEGVYSDTIIYRPLPLYQDTILYSIPIQGMPGNYSFTIELNSNGSMTEIRYDDNTANFSVVVLSTALKVLQPSNVYEQHINYLTVLSPLKKTDTNSVIQLEIDTTTSFITSLKSTQQMGPVLTKLLLPQLIVDKQYYWRVGFLNSNLQKVTGSFIASESDGIVFRQKDSISWMGSNIIDGKYINSSGVSNAGIAPLIKETKWHVISSGNPVSQVTLDVNGQNILPSTFARGHNVAIFDSTTLTLKEIRVFDTFASMVNVDSLRAFIERVSIGELVVILVVDDGAVNLNQNTAIAIAARNAIKSIGSNLIDKLGFRDSWAIIGWKGALPGTVPEMRQAAGTGKAIVDTTFIRGPFTAKIESPEIGPSGKWLNANLTADLPASTSLRTTVIGQNRNGNYDSLLIHQGSGSISLSAIDANIYSKLKLYFVIHEANQSEIPVLREWSVEFEAPAELTYRSVIAQPDSVLEGNNVNVVLDVFNAGSQQAENVKVILTSGANKLLIDSSTIPIIPLDTSRTIVFTFQTIGKKNGNLLSLTIDPQNKLTEYYKENNLYSIPIYVITDTIQPTFDITFDGQRIYDGDYVLPNPTIRINVYDNSPLAIQNNSYINLTLDNRKILLGTDPDSLFETRTGPEKAAVIFKPKLKGRKEPYKLFLEVQDSSGNKVAMPGPLMFMVDSIGNIKNVFNYPNPFSNETHFTFILADYADEIIIKIYTINGRLINEINVPPQSDRAYYQVYWNGRDRDGDEIANGVYFYKIIAKSEGKTKEVIQKLLKLR